MIPSANIGSTIPALVGVVLIVVGLAVMIGAVRSKSTPASLLGLVLAVGGFALILLDR